MRVVKPKATHASQPSANPFEAAKQIIKELADFVLKADERMDRSARDADDTLREAWALRSEAESLRHTRQSAWKVGGLLERASRLELLAQEAKEGASRVRIIKQAKQTALACRRQAAAIYVIAKRAAARATGAVAPRWKDHRLVLASPARTCAQNGALMGALDVPMTTKRPPKGVMDKIALDRAEGLDCVDLMRFHVACLRATIEGGPAPMLASFIRGDSPHASAVDRCPKCRVDRIVSSNGSMRLCPKCYEGVKHVAATADSMSYGEEVDIMAPSYKRSHYFNERLRHRNTVPTAARPTKDTVEGIITHLLHQKGPEADLKTITWDEIQAAKTVTGLLGPAGASAVIMDAHDNALLMHVRGEKLFDLTSEQKAIVRFMFRAIQALYHKWVNIVDPERAQFLTYTLCMDMFFVILGWTSCLPFYTTVKGHQELMTQLCIFKGIFRDLKWDFVVSPHLLAPTDAAVRKKRAAADKRAAVRSAKRLKADEEEEKAKPKRKTKKPRLSKRSATSKRIASSSASVPVYTCV